MSKTPATSLPVQPVPPDDDDSFLGMLKREWPQLKRFLFHFACVAFGVFAAMFFYDKFIIPGKDATIQAKDSIIQSKEAIIEAKQKSVDAIQQTVTAKDDLIISLTNQFYKMVAFQADLATAQTNLVQQQKKLEDVEFIVENLFAKMTSESLSGSDSNRVVVLNKTNNAVQLLVKLESVPIEGSLQLIVTTPSISGRGQQMLPLKRGITIKNVVMLKLLDFDLSTTSFGFQYAIDTRQTNLIHKVEAVEGDAIFDGRRIHLNFQN